MATWKRCSTCKKDIAFEATYYLCNVSTCRRKRTGMVFCSVDCWEVHVPIARHREAWAEEETAPSAAEHAAAEAGQGAGRDGGAGAKPPGKSSMSAGGASSSKPSVRRRVVGAKPVAVPNGPREVLVVASRLKHFIREVYGMNTSDGVLGPLSDELRRLSTRAVERAKEDGRKTLLERDFDFLTKR